MKSKEKNKNKIKNKSNNTKNKDTLCYICLEVPKNPIFPAGCHHPICKDHLKNIVIRNCGICRTPFLQEFQITHPFLTNRDTTSRNAIIENIIENPIVVHRTINPQSDIPIVNMRSEEINRLSKNCCIIQFKGNKSYRILILIMNIILGGFGTFFLFKESNRNKKTSIGLFLSAIFELGLRVMDSYFLYNSIAKHEKKKIILLSISLGILVIYSTMIGIFCNFCYFSNKCIFCFRFSCFYFFINLIFPGVGLINCIFVFPEKYKCAIFNVGIWGFLAVIALGISGLLTFNLYILISMGFIYLLVNIFSIVVFIVFWDSIKSNSNII